MEEGHGRGVTSVFGLVRVTRKAYRNRREPNLYPADARLVLPGDPYSLGMRSLAAFHLAAGGFGQAQEVIEARTGVTVGRAQLTGLAEDLAAWTDDFYAGRSRDAEEEEQPDSDVTSTGAVLQNTSPQVCGPMLVPMPSSPPSSFGPLKPHAMTVPFSSNARASVFPPRSP